MLRFKTVSEMQVDVDGKQIQEHQRLLDDIYEQICNARINSKNEILLSTYLPRPVQERIRAAGYIVTNGDTLRRYTRIEWAK